jgi:hypothetical protein
MRYKRVIERAIWASPAGYLNCIGSVAAEFALAAPVVIVIAAGIADFGMLAARSAALAATTRIGAEFAKRHPLDTSGIQDSMQSAMSFAPTLTFPASFPLSCECDDGTPIVCAESCATVGRARPNRVFIKISASQAFTPLVPWPGIPLAITAMTEVRVQ